ncbi:ribosome-associated translation inhibitor RaiA [Desulfobacter hydrogenophilus]|uniref:Ribosome hibernation promoting factor n=1 Tax=Desulfobacter hydrogenophilus TaxID=2291 RepID=A0A328FL03_9BACT|nr:ribosome-associated translation inhibitor RaiA [Desulfobacter hydrogenophilus]NDY71768.1 ribosome-associated translation inhibitor RaiA [Desulfobacter hydrogenophilus]QBH13466.1 ribosome-associated translation inhibitor RaiA [Desulfobacter hydrogenophilus]RAM03717.1 ribosome-associated translation inhibitor RaiA [Desulfobacter hydrogenophilus]
MQVTITFKKIEASDSLKSYVHKKLKRFDKMLDGPAEANVVLSVEKIRHIAELTLTSGTLNIHAKEASESMYATIDILADKIKGQITKHKEKEKKHMSGNKTSLTDTREFSIDEPLPKDVVDIIEEPLETKPMDIEDAVIELESGKKSFYVFTNARTEQVNVIYKHNNGKLGLIAPQG